MLCASSTTINDSTMSQQDSTFFIGCEISKNLCWTLEPDGICSFQSWSKLCFIRVGRGRRSKNVHAASRQMWYVTLAPTYITFSALQPGLVYMQNFIEIVLCVPYWESFEKLFKKLFWKLERDNSLLRNYIQRISVGNKSSENCWRSLLMNFWKIIWRTLAKGLSRQPLEML